MRYNCEVSRSSKNRFPTQVRSLRVLSKRRFWPANAVSTVVTPGTRLDFLIAGFPRSGTSTTLANLQRERDVHVSDKQMTFNYPPVLRLEDIESFRADLREAVREATEKVGDVLIGFKSENFAFSRHFEFFCRSLPDMKLLFLIRDPIRWLQSMFNMRVHTRCKLEGVGSAGCGGGIEHDFLAVAAGEKNFEDAVRVRFSEILEKIFRSCGRNRVLVLEFELLKQHPAAFFRIVRRFLGLTKKENTATTSSSPVDGPPAVETEGRREDQTAVVLPTATAQQGASPCKRNFVSRNEKDKLHYSYVIQNVLCDDPLRSTVERNGSSQSTFAEQEDRRIYDLLKDFYADEYSALREILRADVEGIYGEDLDEEGVGRGWISNAFVSGRVPERGRAYCDGFFDVSSAEGPFHVLETVSWAGAGQR